MLSFVIPARNRPAELEETLRLLGERPCSAHAPEEVIVLDNNSDEPLVAPPRLENGSGVTLVRLASNEGAAARNRGVEIASGDWIVMLDDDSAPIAGDLAAVAGAQPDEVAAFGGEIVLPSGARESGGVPEVIIGCGCLIRRDAFLEVGGYDPSFGFYAEEYDLCARFIAAGLRVHHTRSVGFLHRKTPAGRSMELILGRLVRNNGWTLGRYAPAAIRDAQIESMIERYRGIAAKENALTGFESGLAELRASLDAQPERALDPSQWSRFTGETAVRRHLNEAVRAGGVEAARIVAPGKGAEIVRAVLLDAGVEVTDQAGGHEVVGTISPGPMLDASANHPGALTPWDFAESPVHCARVR
jgi:N-acetylglucosaminyl-diphospho-decaprenol L-rhamnosyltransferase